MEILENLNHWRSKGKMIARINKVMWLFFIKVFFTYYQLLAS